MSDKIKVIALFGESGAGKDTLMRWMLDNIENTSGMISHTTRPPREYEKQDKDYHFVSDKEFRDLMTNQKMIEMTCFNGWFYGTHIDELKKDKINIGVFNPIGVKNLLTFSSIIKTLPIWIKTDDKIRLLRILNRENNPNCEEICRRFLADKQDFSSIINFNHEIYINNDEITNYKHAHHYLKEILKNENFI